MTPTELENAVLIALRRCGGRLGSDGSTVARLHRLLAEGYDTPASWRDVSKTVSRLERIGLAAIVDEEMVGEDCHPIYALTSPAGVQAAHSARIQQHNAAVAGTAKEAPDAHH